MFLSRVRAQLPDLHRAEYKLGCFLLEFPGDLASYDAQELARLCGVSKATVSRFVRRLGFKNYDSARRAARDERQQCNGQIDARPRQKAGPAEISDAVRDEIDNLIWTYQQVDADDLESLADAVVSARRVWLVGFRLCRVFADYLQSQLVQVVPTCASIPHRGGSLGEYVSEIGPEDLVIWIALGRREGRTEALLHELRRSAVPIALIGDEEAGLAAGVRWQFRCRTETSEAQGSHAAVLSLCSQIGARATQRAGAIARSRLRRIVEVNARLGEV
ncbi:MurR/RpiR family transcriptional regulator [Salipiger sp.]|uniref:MurR/RpiR family transcriptional regulator n=1 Tax=Salipiger sp. TaxID=2078585 RepID=UPI003A9801FA